MTWTHAPVNGFETNQFVLSDSFGSPITGNLTYTTAGQEYTAIVGAYPCVRVRAINTVFSQSPNDWVSALSQTVCLS